jgi:hypothetical protein
MTPTISTSYGWRFAGPLPSIRRIASTDLARLADRLDRLADHHLLNGNPTTADRLTWRAHAVRGLAGVMSQQTSGMLEAWS